MMESWKDINGFEGLYQISNIGNVKSFDMLVIYKDGRKRLQKGRMLSSVSLRGWYPLVNLCKDGKKYPYLIHRLVAIHFIPNPLQLPEVNHIDGDKTNARAINLEWCTGKQNMHHAHLTGLNKSPAENYKLKHGIKSGDYNKKRVAICDVPGIPIKEFESISAGLSELGVNGGNGNVTRSISQKIKAYGKYWMFL